MRKDKEIDELFRERLKNYEQEPPAYLLENVLAGVAGARRKRKIVYWRIASVAAALLLAFVAGWQLKYLNNGAVQQEVVVVQNTSPETKKAISGVPETKTQVAETATIETSGKEMTGEDLPVSSRNSFQVEKISIDPIANVRSAESDLIHPLQILNRLISNNDQFANVLQKMVVKKPVTATEELTIEQQIIEQNQLQLQAQIETQKKARWLVGAQVSPAYNVSRSSHSQVYASNMLNSSATSLDLGGGISVEYKKGKRLSVQSGVYYSGMGQSSGNTSYSNRNLSASADFAANNGIKYFNAPVNIDSKSSKMVMNSLAGVIEFCSVPSGLVLGTNIEEKTLTSSTVVVSDARFIQNFEYIEIPMYLRYTILDSKFDVEMLGGFSTNLLVGNETYMESGNGKNLVGKTQDMEPLNYSGTLGVGFKYGLSKHISLNVEPRIKYYLNSLNSNSSVTYKPYTVGVYTGLSYEF